MESSYEIRNLENQNRDVGTCSSRSLFKVILYQKNHKKMKYDKLKLTGLHKYHSSGLAILNSASVGVKLYQRVGRFRPPDK